MDPDETLRQLRDLFGEHDKDPTLSELRDAMDLFESLDDWLSRGGFLPSAWEMASNDRPS